MAHARIYGPSKAEQWWNCPGSVHLSEGIEDTVSYHAIEGSAAHAVAESTLNGEVDTAHALVDSVVHIGDEGVLITEDMADGVMEYVNNLNELTPEGAIRQIEVEVDFSDMIGQPEAFGTADAIVITENELAIHDLKFGKGVRVNADHNKQLMLYALGAYSLYNLIYDFKTVRLFIHQPRLNHLSEWSLTVDELLAFGEEAERRAARVHTHPDELHPGEAQCRWCKAKATCPALAKDVLDEFDVLPEPSSQHAENDMIARGMAKVEMIEGWCKAVRAETERRLLNGHQIKGFKLVEGRRGPRKWADAKEAEELLKSMRVKNDDMYDQKLISPTSAEKLVKAGRLGPRQWNSIASHITQSEGKPSVAKADDPREALQHEMDFEQIA